MSSVSTPTSFSFPFLPPLFGRRAHLLFPHTSHISDHNVFAQPETHKQCLNGSLVTTSGSGVTLDPLTNLSTSVPMTSNVTASEIHNLSFTMIVSSAPALDRTEMLTCGSKRSQAAPLR